MAEIDSLRVTLRHAGYGSVVAVYDVELEVVPGAVVALLGANGAGKSTVLRAITGSVKCGTRRVELAGKNLSGLPRWKLPHEGLAYVADAGTCFNNSSIAENLKGAFAVGRQRIGDDSAAQSLWDEVARLFPVLAQRPRQLAGTLSGGERKMLCIGRALLMRPRFLLLDEPSAGLAPRIASEVYAKLPTILRDFDVGVLLAEQNVEYARKIASMGMLLEVGRVVAQGTADEVMEKERLRSAYLGEAAGS